MRSATLAYFLSYFLFSFLSKSLGKTVNPVALLPVSVVACCAIWSLALFGDWLIARWRRSQRSDDDVVAELRRDGVAVLSPSATQRPVLSIIERIHHRIFSKHVVVAASASVVVLCASTLAYTMQGVSLLVPLLLMKGGVYLWGPVVDWINGTSVSSRARLVLGLAIVAVAGALWHKVHVSVANVATAAALGCAAAYVAAYFPKLRVMSRYRGDVDFLFAEMTTTLIIALPVSFAIGSAWSLFNHTAALQSLLTAYLVPYASLGPLLSKPAVWLLSLASQGCGLFGGLIFMARVESTLSVPLNRCTSLLGGFVATVALWHGGVWSYLSDAANTPELVGVAAMLAALWVGLPRSGVGKTSERRNGGVASGQLVGGVVAA